MPTARMNAVAPPGAMGVFGGRSGRSIRLRPAAYDPVANAWTTRPAMPTARGALGIGGVSGLLYAIGGRNDIPALATNERFMPYHRGGSCDTVGAPVFRKAMSHPSIGALGAGSREDFEADVVLRDGSTVRVRAVRTADESRLLEFLRDLSPSSRTLRFGGGVSDYYLRQAAGRLARDDSEHALGLIAMSGPTRTHRRARDVRGDRPRSRRGRVRDRGRVSGSGAGHHAAGRIGPDRVRPRHPSLRGRRPPAEPPDAARVSGLRIPRSDSCRPGRDPSSSSRPS